MELLQFNIFLILILTFVSVTILVAWLSDQIQKSALGFTANRKVFYQESIDRLFLHQYRSQQLLNWTFLAILVAFILASLFTSSVYVAIVIAVLVWFLPILIFQNLISKRQEAFEENFPGTLDKMVSAGRGNMSLVQIFEFVAKNDNPPASQEFSRAVQEYKMGKDLSEVIEDMRRRLNSKQFELFATSVQVNRDKGGNLPEALQTMSASFKEMMRLEEKITTASAEGRKGARLISLMPIGIFIFVSLAQPALIETLVSNFVGWILISIAAILYVGGLLWLRRVLDIDI